MSFLTTAKKRVEVALKMDELFLNWQAEFSPEDALAFVEKAEIYNRMTRKGMVGLIQFINKKTARLTDSPHHFRIGNESSRVVYAIFTEVPKDKAEKFFGDIERFAKTNTHTDEYNLSRNQLGWWECRLWWD